MYVVSWNEFESLSIELAKKIHRSNIKYSAIIGINRGGLLLARLLSSMLELPMGVIDAKFSGNKYIVDDNVSMIYSLKGNVLLVDDILEKTSLDIVLKIKQKYKLDKISLACVFYKTNKEDFKPEYYVNQVDSFLKVIFPYQEQNINKHFKQSL